MAIFSASVNRPYESRNVVPRKVATTSPPPPPGFQMATLEALVGAAPYGCVVEERSTFEGTAKEVPSSHAPCPPCSLRAPSIPRGQCQHLPQLVVRERAAGAGRPVREKMDRPPEVPVRIYSSWSMPWCEFSEPLSPLPTLFSRAKKTYCRQGLRF